MNIVDSHAHLSMAVFDDDRHDVIRAAFEEGISAILCPAEITEPHSVRTTCDLTDQYANIIASAGVHPHNAKHFTRDSVTQIQGLAREKKIHAVGEIGLDFHYSFSSPDLQIEAFRRQLNVAQDLDLPVIIHSREAASDIINCIQEERFARGGVLHCFTEDMNFAKRMVDENFLISFSGIVTFPKAHELREVARKLPLTDLLVETDSPFLTPAPYRGKITRNEPKYVTEIAQFVADLKNISRDDFFVRTTQNFTSLFGIELSSTRC
ncbi:MAG: TatD family hydrolase [Candidatus Aminicenantes bacterium]|jgi:TatD DNase family protein